MKVGQAYKTATLFFVLLLAGSAFPVRALCATLLWQTFPQGSAASFDWVHELRLDIPNGVLYAAGKSSSTASGQDGWLNAYRSESGFPVWSPPLLRNSAGAGCWGFEEELVSGLALLPGGRLMLSGRSAQNSGGSCTWFARRGGVVNAVDFFNDDMPAGSALPQRGMDVAVAGQHGWILSLVPSDAPSLLPGYLFSKFQAVGLKVLDSKFNSGDLNLYSEWPGDCCYDYPNRMAAVGNYIFALMGADYAAGQGYGFIMGRYNISGGGITKHTYQGGSGGMDVADGLLVNSDASKVYVIAKTSDVVNPGVSDPGGFMTRLLCFSNALQFQWRMPVLWNSSPVLDAVFDMDPEGNIWVVESATGKAMKYSPAGEQLLKVQLPGAGAGRYIGSVLAAESGNLYVAGSDSARGWIAKYSLGTVPSGPEELQGYNFPNPFDSSTELTTIRYTLVANSEISAELYDTLGKKVRSWRFSSGQRGGTAGINEFTWSGESTSGKKVHSGMYLMRIATIPAKYHRVFRIGVKH